MREKARYFEIELKGTGYYSNAVYHKILTDGKNGINMKSLYDMLLKLEKSHRDKIVLEIREVETEFVHQFDDELFTVYLYKDPSYCSQWKTYRTFTDLLNNFDINGGDFVRKSYQIGENGVLNENYTRNVNEFEAACVVSKDVLSEEKFMINEMNELENIYSHSIHR